MNFTALSIVILLVYLAYKFIKPKRKFPPGPWFKLPIVGHIQMFLGNMLKNHIEARKKYGDIVGVYLGSYPNMVLHTAPLAKEAFSHPLLSGRADIPVFNEAAGGKYGIIPNDGNSWVEQRRFTLRHLRDFGFAKATMEASILEEVTELVESFAKEAGKPINVKNRFGVVVLNSLWRLVTGERFSHSDPKLKKIQDKLEEAFQGSPGGQISFFVPWLADAFPNFTGFEKFKEATKAPFPFYREQINFHKTTFQSGEARDFIDAYLQEMKTTKDPQSSFYGAEGEKNLIAVVHDLFVGGSETTSLTLAWLFLYLAAHPEVQEKLHDEIKTVIGTSRNPSLNDRPKMHYTEAVIAENFRRSSFIPFTITHTAMEDMEFHGYFLAKDSHVTSFNYGIHHDPAVWGDPKNFRPERFLSSDGTFQKSEHLIPFSVGRRSCPGESFARDNLFMMITTVFQRFKISLDPTQPKPSLEPRIAMFLVPQPYKVVFEDKLNSRK